MDRRCFYRKTNALLYRFYSGIIIQWKCMIGGVVVIGGLLSCYNQSTPTGPTTTTATEKNMTGIDTLVVDTVAISLIEPFQSIGGEVLQGKLVAYAPEEVITKSEYCSGDTMVREYDTIPERYDTITVSLRNDSLHFLKNLTQGAFYFKREQGGSGIDGWWAALKKNDTPSIDTANHDNWLIRTTFKHFQYLYFEQNTLYIYSSEKKSPSVKANLFIRTWKCGNPYLCLPWFSDSAKYDIEVQKANHTHVRMVGNKTNEQVDVVWEEFGLHFTKTFSSSNPEHPVHVHDTRVCPYTPSPAWWEEFLDANKR